MIRVFQTGKGFLDEKERFLGFNMELFVLQD